MARTVIENVVEIDKPPAVVFDCASDHTSQGNASLAYSGTPNTSGPAGAKYGQYIHDHILALSRSRMPVPQGAPTSPGSRGGLAQSTPTALPPR
jgi:hypothetical protein